MLRLELKTLLKVFICIWILMHLSYVVTSDLMLRSFQICFWVFIFENWNCVLYIVCITWERSWNAEHWRTSSHLYFLMVRVATFSTVFHRSGKCHVCLWKVGSQVVGLPTYAASCQYWCWMSVHKSPSVISFERPVLVSRWLSFL